jgi:hypothetical protein
MRDHLMVAVLCAHNLQKFVEYQKNNHNKLEVIVKGWAVIRQFKGLAS